MIRRPRQRQRGFTLTELMIVIGLIVLLIAVGLPSIGAMFASGRLQNAVATVESTVTASRAFATREAVVSGGDYAGAAALFLDGEIRIVRHSSFNGDEAQFTDVTDPIFVHPDISIVAISRGGTGLTGLKLIPPPFAVRFDADGTLIVRRHNSNNESVSVHHTEVTGGDGGVQSVIGVIVYEAPDLIAAEGSDITAEVDGDSDQGQWVRNNGSSLLFNRYSGVVVKEN